MSEPSRFPPTVPPEAPADSQPTKDSLTPPEAASSADSLDTDYGDVVRLRDRDAEAGASTPAAPDQPSDLAGRYQLLGEIGRGGMGAVLRGRDPTLGRDLAIKVLLEQYAGRPEVVQRFREEAQIGGQLQHPGAVPVYELGVSGDTPYFTMKLVKGVTLAKLLRERTGPAQDRPRFLKVFEQVCQTVAYAHSKGVIHRDLKPANIMVGAFGEVQVMDWGLAKVLTPPGATPVPPAVARETGPSLVKVSQSDSLASDTQEGEVLGTPAYMPPEQALGEISRLDERCDVFSLGAILCEILTSRPPYTGSDRVAVLRQARRSELPEALARLDHCEADEELVGLAKRCLSAEPGGRPRDAGDVAKAVEAHLAAVEERARQAELERAAAEARAAAERRARRLTLGLAASVLLFIVTGGGGAWLWQKQREEAAWQRQQTDREARLAMASAREFLKEGWEKNDGERLTAALAEADKAVKVASSGGASDDVRQEAGELRKQAEEKVERARKNVALLAALLNVTAPRETKQYERSESGTMIALAEPSVEEQFREAFRRWNLDLDHTPLETLAAWIGDQPEKVVQEIVAGLDTWMLDRRGRDPASEWQRLFRLVEELDRDEDSRQLRRLLVSGELEREAAVRTLARRLMPASALAETPPGKQTQRLRKLAAAAKPGGPVLRLVALTRALEGAGDVKGAERLLRAAATAQPDQVAPLGALGKLLERQGSAHRREAIAFYRAARAVQPRLGIALGQALLKVGRAAEAEEVFVNLRSRQPNNPEMSFYLGVALRDQKRYGDTEAAYRRAIAIRPDFPEAHNNLGTVLLRQGQFKEAEAAYREAIALKPNYPEPHNNLAAALYAQKKLDEAVVALHKAIDLHPDYAYAYINLGIALYEQKKLPEAVAVWHKVIELKPDDAVAYFLLGTALYKQKNLTEAEATFRQAIALQPDYAKAYTHLGNALAGQKKLDEAVATFKKGIALNPDEPLTYNNLGFIFYQQKKLKEAVAAYRKAIDLKPDYAEAYNHLGLALRQLKKLDDAVAAFRKATTLKPDFAFAYSNLGNAPSQLKKLDDAVAAHRKADQLSPNHPGIRYNLRQTERLLKLDKQLPAILAGKTKLSSPQERIEFALFCASYKERPRTAVGFFTDAFTAEPKLANDLQAQHRYHAASAAALAAAGKGVDAASLDDKERVRLRQRALDWLRADLAAYTRLAEKKDGRQFVQQRLAHWQEDTDLAALRDAKPLAALPEKERAAWQQLWVDVAALRKKLDGKE